MRKEHRNTQVALRFWEVNSQNHFGAPVISMFFYIFGCLELSNSHEISISDKEIAEMLSISRNKISEYRETLKQAGLIDYRKEGSRRWAEVVYSINDFNAPESALKKKSNAPTSALNHNDNALQSALKKEPYALQSALENDFNAPESALKIYNKLNISGLENEPNISSRMGASADARCCCCLNNNNINNITSTTGKEYGGVGEKENQTAEDVKETAKDSGQVKLEMERFTTELKKSPLWGEAVCKNNHINTSELSGWLDSFLLFCLSEGVEHDSLREFKSHFNRWLPRRIDYQKNKTENETNREDKFSRRRGTNTIAKTASDYSTTF